MSIRVAAFAAVALCASAVAGGTVKVPLKSGWKFVKADDPAAGAAGGG